MSTKNKKTVQKSMGDGSVEIPDGAAIDLLYCLREEGKILVISLIKAMFLSIAIIQTSSSLTIPNQTLWTGVQFLMVFFIGYSINRYETRRRSMPFHELDRLSKCNVADILSNTLALVQIVIAYRVDYGQAIVFAFIFMGLFTFRFQVRLKSIIDDSNKTSV